ncbi:MAG: hypothetical protein LBO65_05690, partial [Spirochaetaceae bacterium]|nr:hypothetical protein [Spirochaetaceae bacterium]
MEYKTMKFTDIFKALFLVPAAIGLIACSSIKPITPNLMKNPGASSRVSSLDRKFRRFRLNGGWTHVQISQMKHDCQLKPLLVPEPTGHLFYPL